MRRVRRDEDARHLGPRERSPHGLGRPGPDDDRRPGRVRVPEPGDVVDAVEHERILERDGRIALDGDLGHLPARRSEPARPHPGSHLDRVAGLEVHDLRLARERAKLGRRARSGAGTCPSGTARSASRRAARARPPPPRAHREVVADREDGDVRLVDPADQRPCRRRRTCRRRSRASCRSRPRSRGRPARRGRRTARPRRCCSSGARSRA